MEVRPWSREVECRNCGSILTITAEDKIKWGQVYRENLPIPYVECLICKDMIDIGSVPKVVWRKAIFG